MKSLPYNTDVLLFKAVGITLYLIIDVERPLKFAFSSLSKKYNAKPIKRIKT